MILNQKQTYFAQPTRFKSMKVSSIFQSSSNKTEQLVVKRET